MDVFTTLRRRRPRERLHWQGRRDWYLRDLERLSPREGRPATSGRPQDVRVWVTAFAYNQIINLQGQLLASARAQESNDSALVAKDWPRPDYSDVQLPVPRSARYKWEVIAVCCVCILLLLLLCTWLESLGFQIMPKPCSTKYNLEQNEPPVEPTTMLEDLPPPYSDTQSANAPTTADVANLPYVCIANYTPIANESPPPAYSEAFVQIPNLKVYYTNEMQDPSLNGMDRDGDHETNENVANGSVESTRFCQCHRVPVDFV